MSLAHKLVLYACLGLLGLSLFVPGAIGVVRPSGDVSGLQPQNVDAANHLRALNGMMAAIGLVALWTCLDLAKARPLVLALGVTMAALVVARASSIALDGAPGAATKLYLAVELVLAVVFLFWPPPPAE